MDSMTEVLSVLTELQNKAAQNHIRIRLLQLKPQVIDQIVKWHENANIPYEGKLLGFELIPFYDMEPESKWQREYLCEVKEK